ncbi:MAG: hypothetical protein LH619_07400 [Chitinophagaceae bacterium]|nr:hypothetical protein [Chitinophagaceae bacterium]
MSFRIYFLSALFLCSSLFCIGQNISGLQNKKLNKAEDLGSALESLIGRIGGSVDGSLYSVIVLNDSENELRIKIWYTGYVNASFNVSAMTASRQRQIAIKNAKFKQSTAASPAECILTFDDKEATGLVTETPFLRIDISKRQDGSGKVKVFQLGKMWKTGAYAPGVIINVPLLPVGTAASLNMTQPGDVIPAKKISFDPRINYYQKSNIRPGGVIRTTGGANAISPDFRYNVVATPEDISGTWTNTDANTRNITKMVITNNNAIQVYSRTSGQDFDWGKKPLSKINEVTYSANFKQSSNTSNVLQIVFANNELQVKNTQKISLGFGMDKSVVYNNAFKRNIKIAFLNPAILNLDNMATLYTATTPGQPVDKTPLGPLKNVQLNLWDGLLVDNLVNFDRPQDISSINMNVFYDKNPNSGVFYILPADYHLKWSKENGYGLRINYGEQETGTESTLDAPVRMSATLTPGISNREKLFVQSLLKAKYPAFTELKFLPLRENLITTFPATLNSLYDIPLEKIAVTSGTDLTGDINISWRTNAGTKDFIQTALTSREGISAAVFLNPADEEILDQQVPAIINLADNRVIGKLTLEPATWRGKNWRNETLYPLKLQYLHVLKKTISTNKPIIYSWAMNGAEVPPMAQVAFDNSRVPVWLDNDPNAVMWLEYSVMNCTECDNKVMDTITGGVSGKTIQQVKFTIPPAVFDTLKASYFLITVRSSQADPKGIIVKELDGLKITKEDTKIFQAGPLFQPPGGNLDFEYKITVASSDGDFYISEKWTSSSSKEVLLGKTQLKELFKGIIPGIN